MSMHPKHDPKRMRKDESKEESRWIFIAFIAGIVIGVLTCVVMP